MTPRKKKTPSKKKTSARKDKSATAEPPPAKSSRVTGPPCPACKSAKIRQLAKTKFNHPPRTVIRNMCGGCGNVFVVMET